MIKIVLGILFVLGISNTAFSQVKLDHDVKNMWVKLEIKGGDAHEIFERMQAAGFTPEPTYVTDDWEVDAIHGKDATCKRLKGLSFQSRMALMRSPLSRTSCTIYIQKSQ